MIIPPDFPNPVLAPRPQVVDAPPNLVVQGTFPAPFFQTDWPNPILPRYAQQIPYEANLLLTHGAFPAPFSQVDWPVPLGARQREIHGFTEPQYPLWVNIQQISVTTVTMVAPEWIVTLDVAPLYIATLSVN